MGESSKYYVLKQKAVPEVLLKVVEVKKILESEKSLTVQEATEKVGLSRSSFYKYKNDIFPFTDNARGKTITFILQMNDEPGILSYVLQQIAEYNANILTINQTVPINGVASLTISIEVLPSPKDISGMIENIESRQGVHYLKILASEK
jgi:chorismate mutase